jgi:hypothetical protein
MNKTRLILCALGVASLTGLSSYGATVETKGYLKYECWFPPLRDAAATGVLMDYLYNDPAFQAGTPDMLSYTIGLNTRTVFPDDNHAQYGARISGWLTPTVTGDYNFYLRSDDSSQFWISSDATEANLMNVAEEFDCCDPFQEVGDLSTTLTPIYLEAGQKYAIALLVKEATGGDFAEVAWQLASGTTPAASLTPLTSAMLSSQADPAGGTLTITQQPVNTTTAENVPVTFTIGVTAVTPYGAYTVASEAAGTPTQGGAAPLGTKAQVATFYQWYTNNVEVTGANSATFSIAWPKMSQNGMKVKCYVAVPGVPVTSSEATLTVTADTVKPTVVSATPDATFTNLVIQFSEPVSDTALTAGNYVLDQGASVSAVGRINATTVRLQTSVMGENKTYNLTVNNVQDTATTPNTITSVVVPVRTFVFMAGTVLHKKYNSIDDNTGGSPANLFADARFPDAPDRQDLLAVWEYPPDGQGRVAADPARNYFDSIEGFFIPPATGDYVILTAGADRWWLYLSTDENPANKKLVAAQPGGWTQPRFWLTGESTDTTPHRTDTYPSTEWPDGNTLHLTGGKKYYMLEVHHDPSWCGADDFSATYKLATDDDPANGTAPTLNGSVIGYYFDPTGASINFTTQPQSASVLQGGSAKFTAAATGVTKYGTTALYQWQSAPKGSSTFTDIAGAKTASYSTPLLTLADDGTQYRVVVTAPPITSNSVVAVVTVVGDSTPPVATVGAMAGTTAGTVDVGVAFDEPVTFASANTIGNYSVSPGTITGIKVYTNRFTANSQNPLAKLAKHSVLLTVTGLSGSGTLTVKDVADIYGNKMPSTALSFTVDTVRKWGVVGANEFGGENAVVPVAANGWDVYSDGMTAWAAYDEATFVYEEITGDFDKKVRVEYQDGSSQWARAGIIARDVTNFGVDRTAQTGSGASAAPYDGVAGRYQKVLVTPVGATLTGPGTGGAADWELNRRLDTGSQTTGATFTGTGSTPLYPQAWCRLKREGQKFTMFRSDDGVAWVELGSTTWGVDDEAKIAMPAKMYVGPEYAPEIGNVSNESDRGTFLARFREYGTYVAVFNPGLTVNRDATGKITITWTSGTLVSSPAVDGNYTAVAGATSPYVPTPTTTTFYKVKQ